MKGLFLILLSIAIFAGCAKYNDPEIEKRIIELESKDKLDDFEKEELKDLKEQGSYGTTLSTDTCKI